MTPNAKITLQEKFVKEGDEPVPPGVIEIDLGFEFDFHIIFEEEDHTSPDHPPAMVPNQQVADTEAELGASPSDSDTPDLDLSLIFPTEEANNPNEDDGMMSVEIIEVGPDYAAANYTLDDHLTEFNDATYISTPNGSHDNVVSNQFQHTNGNNLHGNINNSVIILPPPLMFFPPVYSDIPHAHDNSENNEFNIENIVENVSDSRQLNESPLLSPPRSPSHVNNHNIEQPNINPQAATNNEIVSVADADVDAGDDDSESFQNSPAAHSSDSISNPAETAAGPAPNDGNWLHENRSQFYVAQTARSPPNGLIPNSMLVLSRDSMFIDFGSSVSEDTSSDSSQQMRENEEFRRRNYRGFLNLPRSRSCDAVFPPRVTFNSSNTSSSSSSTYLEPIPGPRANEPGNDDNVLEDPVESKSDLSSITDSETEEPPSQN